MSDKKEGLLPIDLSSVVVPFYTQALVNLGINTDPLTGEKREDLDAAKNLIDLIDFIREKMEGNLTENEEKFFDTILKQLKTEYLRKKEIIKL